MMKASLFEKKKTLNKLPINSYYIVKQNNSMHTKNSIPGIEESCRQIKKYILKIVKINFYGSKASYALNSVVHSLWFVFQT